MYVFGETRRFQGAREQEITEHSILRSFTPKKKKQCSLQCKVTSVQPCGGDP